MITQMFKRTIASETPSLPDADPRHDGFRSNGRKSNFRAEKLNRTFTAGLIFSLVFSFCREGAGSGIFTYEKIHFTQDGSPTGTPLVPV